MASLLQPTLCVCHGIDGVESVVYRSGQASALHRSCVVFHGGVCGGGDEESSAAKFFFEKNSLMEEKGRRGEVMSFVEEMYVLDLIGRRWFRYEVDGVLPKGRCYHSIVGVNSSIFMFGGITQKQDDERHSGHSDEKVEVVNELWELDLQTRRWSRHEVPHFIDKKFNCKLLVVNENNEDFDTKLLIIGGQNANKRDTSNSNKIDLYNITKKKWEYPIILTSNKNKNKNKKICINTSNCVIFENILCFYDSEKSYVYKIKLDFNSPSFHNRIQTNHETNRDDINNLQQDSRNTWTLEKIKIPIHLVSQTMSAIYRNNFLFSGYEDSTNEYIFLTFDLTASRLLQINTNCSCNISNHNYQKMFIWTSHFQIICIGASEKTKNCADMILAFTLPFLQPNLYSQKLIQQQQNENISLTNANKDILNNDVNNNNISTISSTTSTTKDSGPTRKEYTINPIPNADEMQNFLDFNFNRKKIEDKKEHIESIIPASKFAKYMQYMESAVPRNVDGEPVEMVDDDITKVRSAKYFGRVKSIPVTRNELNMNLNTIYNINSVNNNSIYPVYAMVLGKDTLEVFGKSLADFELISKEGDAIHTSIHLLRKRWGRYFDFLISTGVTSVSQEQNVPVYVENDEGPKIHRTMSESGTFFRSSMNNSSNSDDIHDIVGKQEENDESISSKTITEKNFNRPHSQKTYSGGIEGFNRSNSNSKNEVKTLSTNGMVFRVPFEENNLKKSLRDNNDRRLFSRSYSTNSPNCPNKLKRSRFSSGVISNEPPKIPESRSALSLSNISGLSHEFPSPRRSSTIQQGVCVGKRPDYITAGSVIDDQSTPITLNVLLPDTSEPPNIPLAPPPRKSSLSIKQAPKSSGSDVGPISGYEWFKNGCLSSGRVINSFRSSGVDYSPRTFQGSNSGFVTANDTVDMVSSSSDNIYTRRSTISSKTNLIQRRNSIRTDHSRSICSSNSYPDSNFSIYSGGSNDDNINHLLDMDPLLTPRGLYLPWSTASLEAFTEFFFTGKINGRWPVKTVVLDLLIMSKIYEIPLLYTLIAESLFTIVLRKKQQLEITCNNYKMKVENIVEHGCGGDLERSTNYLKNNKLYQSIVSIKASADKLDDGFYNPDVAKKITLLNLNIGIGDENLFTYPTRESSITSSISYEQPFKQDFFDNLSSKSCTNLNIFGHSRSTSVDTSRRSSIGFGTQNRTKSNSGRNNSESVFGNNFGIARSREGSGLHKLSNLRSKSVEELKYLGHLQDISSDLNKLSLYESPYKEDQSFDTSYVLTDGSKDLGFVDSDSSLSDFALTDFQTDSTNFKSPNTNFVESNIADEAIDPLSKVGMKNDLIHNIADSSNMNNHYKKKGSTLSDKNHNSNLILLDNLTCPDTLPANDSLIRTIYKKSILVNDLRLMIRCIDCLDISRRLNIITKEINQGISQIEEDIKAFYIDSYWRPATRKIKSSDIRTLSGRDTTNKTVDIKKHGSAGVIESQYLSKKGQTRPISNIEPPISKIPKTGTSADKPKKKRSSNLPFSLFSKGK